MSMSSKKHIFIVSSDCIFSANLLTNFIYKGVLDSKDLKVVIYDKGLVPCVFIDDLLNKNIEVVSWGEFKGDNVCCYETLTALSLDSFNAKIVLDCIELGFIVPSDVNIIITDDEVDRWFKLYNKKNRLIACRKSMVDENVLAVLGFVDNYMCPYDPLGKLLEEILGRQLNILDVVVPFTILSYELLEIAESSILKEKISNKGSNRKRIMIQTKPWSRRDSLYWLSVLLLHFIRSRSKDFGKPITLGLWVKQNKVNLMFVSFIKALITIRRMDVKFELLEKVTPEEYLFKIYEFDCLILQDRGGFSTAKYFVEKIGRVVVKRNSINHKTFKHAYECNIDNVYKLDRAILVCMAEPWGLAGNSFNKLIADKNNSSLKLIKYFFDGAR